MKRFQFNVEHPGEPGAGIRAYSDRVSVEVESGETGGEGGEFEGEVRDFLAEWFDGAGVTLESVEDVGEGKSS